MVATQKAYFHNGVIVSDHKMCTTLYNKQKTKLNTGNSTVKVITGTQLGR